MLDEKRRIREIRIAEEEYFWHKGLEEGMEKGLEQGVASGKESIVLHMFQKGLSPDVISDLTGLPLSQVRSLQSAQLSET